MYHSLERSGHLSDDRLLEALESLELTKEEFGHAEHVRVAFLYLQRFGLIESLRRVRKALLRFAGHHGAAEHYHETVTWAHVFLIHERMAAQPELEAWRDFARANPDLLRWRDGAFFEHYGADVLESELARRTFVLPR